MTFLRYLWCCLVLFALHMRLYFAHRRIGSVRIENSVSVWIEKDRSE